MKKLLLASVFAIASFPGYAHATDTGACLNDDGKTWDQDCLSQLDEKGYFKDEKPPKPPARVTVAPPYQGPPPIGWVYGPYTVCGELGCQVSVQADGLNVRNVPNGYPVMSLVNGVPLIPYRREGNWLLVGTACDLTPTWAWSWTAGVPLMRCWVYF